MTGPAAPDPWAFALDPPKPPEDLTAVVPAAPAAIKQPGAPGPAGIAAPPAGSPARTWFDDRLQAFLDALSFDADRRPRTPAERRALAAAARDMIERLALRAPGEAWPASAVLQPNQLLANTYYVRIQLARGGVGEVYRARHRDLRTEHAIKILLPQHTLDTTYTAMLQQEARLLSKVRHGGVVGCQGLLRDGDGRMFLVMDYVRGHTLSTRLREAPLTFPALLALAQGLANALAAVHAAGLVHHDISPDNIMLANDDVATPVIIDFGVARPLSPADEFDLLIDFAGKYSWMSPEQLAPRQPAGQAAPPDPRSDLYSLGLVLAAAARGRKLDMGADPETARAARLAVPSLDGIPEPLLPLLTALLDPNPANRPASAAAVLDALASPNLPAASLLLRWLTPKRRQRAP